MSFSSARLAAQKVKLTMRARVSPLASCTLTPLQSLIARRWRPKWLCQSCRNRRPQRRNLATASTIPADSQKPYYVTTPIFYVNAAPHVGHMYTMVLADVIKRWQQLKGSKAILCTGTDEHGMKIQQAAAKAGIEPKDFCDKGAEVFRDLAGRLDVSNDVFVRTSDVKHKEAVQYAWQMLEQERYIYESKHEGWYSVSDETFYPKGQVELIVEPQTGRKIMVSIETGKEVEWTSERNYHFRLSAFKDPLLRFYEQNPDFILPRFRMDDMIREVSSGLEDLSISRPVDRLTWGVRVPNDNSQTIYVWLDALLNYATAAGYPFSPGSQDAGGWPANVHIIGKDIMRFHCIYWPAFLMALDLPLPKQILTHGHWTLGKKKMSKSTGNGVNPFFALERFGLDVMRWYLIHDGPTGDDASYDNTFIVEKYKKNLQDALGNLASRILRFKGWDVRRAVQRLACSDFDSRDEDSREIYDALRNTPTRVDESMQELVPRKALRIIMQAIYRANAYTQKTEPWALARKMTGWKQNPAEQERLLSAEQKETNEAIKDELDRIVYANVETLRLVGIMLQPFMPDTASRLLDMLGVEAGRRYWQWCAVGCDDSYGTPKVDLGRGEQGHLFPGLTSDF